MELGQILQEALEDSGRPKFICKKRVGGVLFTWPDRIWN